MLGIFMWFAYVDESKENNSFFVYSALIIESDAWNDTFAAVKTLRQQLRQSHGIFINKELHAWKFAAGKGQISDRVLDKQRRAVIFAEVLKFIAESGKFKLISSVNTSEFYAFDRLMNRLNRTAQAKKTNVLLFCDEGQETVFTKRIRKMRVYNQIPSNRGVWQDNGSAVKNIPIQNIIEDPIFKKSHMSYFIQLVDFCAYVLLRKEKPIASRSELGYDKMYASLKPCIETAVAPKCKESLGIIR
ncbi:MAG: DUF3800 domain-containing protein [Roseomonas sp.]|nr:DUF3800 domain-containing protein [Roseomonas sp.]